MLFVSSACHRVSLGDSVTTLSDGLPYRVRCLPTNVNPRMEFFTYEERRVRGPAKKKRDHGGEGEVFSKHHMELRPSERR